MSARRFSRKHGLPTGHLRPQDTTGNLFDSSRDERHERKTRQLCEQVFEALTFALANCRDPLVRECYLEEVEPWPSASRLRVSVSAEEGVDAEQLLEALARVSGYLRREVTGHITRKRAPTLCFALAVPPEEVEP